VAVIRLETAGDAEQVRVVHERAFGQTLEADLVERLRQACPEALSLVADDRGIVGHILFTPVLVESDDQPTRGMGLAPMAVLPYRQRQGIGSQLVRHGLDMLRARRCPFVVVVGHPQYYPRFGFDRASAHGVACQWTGVPDEAFMIAVLDTNVMRTVAGIARYRDEFN
jgi:putative acetyltransferase